jgi:hypothetical protein
MNLKLAAELVKGVVRKLAPSDVKDRVRDAVAKVLTVAHKTNPSGNNMSQR